MTSYEIQTILKPGYPWVMTRLGSLESNLRALLNTEKRKTMDFEDAGGKDPLTIDGLWVKKNWNKWITEDSKVKDVCYIKMRLISDRLKAP